MADTLLEVNNLCVDFGTEKILKNISFSVKKGEVIIIVGPNGAGKSTLFRAILDLIHYNGRVTWKTKSISYLPPHETILSKNIPPLTVRDFFLLKKNINKKAIHEILKQVGLVSDFEKKQFSELSTGQFQRMLIAWSLINNPSVILFDDPANAIDIEGQRELYQLIKSNCEKRNMTIMMITHNLNFVWEQATHVICLNKTIVCQGKPESILTPENLYKVYGWGVKRYEHKHN